MKKRPGIAAKRFQKRNQTIKQCFQSCDWIKVTVSLHNRQKLEIQDQNEAKYLYSWLNNHRKPKNCENPKRKIRGALKSVPAKNPFRPIKQSSEGYTAETGLPQKKTTTNNHVQGWFFDLPLCSVKILFPDVNFALSEGERLPLLASVTDDWPRTLLSRDAGMLRLIDWLVADARSTVATASLVGCAPIAPNCRRPLAEISDGNNPV